MSVLLLPAKGAKLDFGYKTHEIWRPRTMHVLKVRDTLTEPLDPYTILTDPDRKRGRFLITGLDLEEQKPRSFYWELMDDPIVHGGTMQFEYLPAEPPQAVATSFRLGLFDPCEPDESVEYVGPVYHSTPDDELVMRLSIAKYNALARKEGFPLCVGVFPWRET